MTRVDVAATRCAVLRVVSLSIVALFSLALAACGGHSDVTGSSQSVAAPVTPATPPVSLSPAIGATPDVTGKLTDAMNSSARDRQINLAGEKEADYNVRGYLVAENVSKGTKLSYIWDITNKNGKAVRRIQGEEIIDGRKSSDPWSSVDETTLKKVAVRTTTELSDWLTKQAATSTAHGSGHVANSSASSATVSKSVKPAGGSPVMASMTPVSAAPEASASVTFVTPVSGAPGDGQAALTEAMKRHLSQQGVKLTESHSAGSYTVTGSVQMGAAEDGQQPITIRWFVKDPNGKALSNAVVQRNKVPAGSLDGTWGQIADLAAGEAAKKVAELLPKPAS